MSDKTSWAWFIPLANGTTSVGVVLKETSSREKKSKQPDAKAHYFTELQLTPGLIKLLGDARFLMVVLAVYKQIHAQNEPVWSDINKDNFDRAFDLLCQVLIHGAADAEKMIESVIQRSIDFCASALAPAIPELHESVGKRVDPSLLSSRGPILAPETIAEVAKDDEEAQDLLKEMNSLKAVNGMYNWAENFEEDNTAFTGVVCTSNVRPQSADVCRSVCRQHHTDVCRHWARVSLPRSVSLQPSITV
ncbi:hypothetical protein MVEN_01097300 [Mycena venus]|uniref:Uncharacterized protein n=1 Tax=Mycena venus TaxID=2733690 RepID=A0A8H7CXF0_9AGAR|nr:hypothetical protein MVEN_01097300 [Mycena venus]